MDTDTHRAVNLQEILILSNKKQDEYNLIKKWYSTRDWLSELRSLQHQKKNDKQAEMIKDKGNIAYGQGDYYLAIKLYTEALLFANQNSLTYGAILANISSSLFELRLFKKCVIYIDACLATSYRNTSRPKLYVRKIKALCTIGEKSRVEGAISDFKKFMKKCKMSSADKDKYFKLAEEAKRVPEAYDMDIFGDFMLPELKENSKILNVSSSAILKYDKKNGRHIVAQALIKKGECILMEKPYASVGPTRCPNCFKNIKSTITCEQCPGIMYCSKVCREQDNEVHKWECKLYQLEKFRELDDGIHLAFRVFLKGLLGGYKTNPNKIEEELQFGNETDNFPYVQQIYGNTSQIPTEKTVFHLDGCCIILAYINMDTDLKEWIRSKIGSDLYLIGKHLLKLMGKCSINSRHCTDLDGLSSNSLYPSLSLFNHSCVANTLFCYQEDRMVLRALQDIQPGEQIYSNYIRSIMDEMSRETRQEHLLTNYCVTCKCTLCTADIEPKGMLPCPKCSCYSDLDDMSQINCRKCKARTTFSWDKILKMKTIADSEKLYVICKDIKLLNEGIKVAQEMQLNPNCCVMTELYIKYIHECIKSGYLDESANYLQYIRDIQSGICSTNIEIFATLKVLVKKMCFSNEWYIPKYKKSTLIEYEKHLAFMDEFFSLYFPSEPVLQDLKKLQIFFGMQKQIVEFRESFEWF